MAGSGRSTPTSSEVPAATEFLDITDRVSSRRSEEGLLGLALDPTNAAHLYVYYSAADPRRSVVSRFTLAADRSRVDPDSELVILEVWSSPTPTHNGGQDRLRARRLSVHRSGRRRVCGRPAGQRPGHLFAAGGHPPHRRVPVRAGAPLFHPAGQIPSCREAGAARSGPTVCATRGRFSFGPRNR